MKKYIVLFILIYLIKANGSYAQTITVLSAEKNQPLISAHISAKNLQGNARQVFLTDVNGKADLSSFSVNADPFIIEISHLGYTKLTDTIDPKKTGYENKVYTMTGENVGLNDVVITAQYAPNNPEKSVHKIRIIDQKKIQAMAANNLRDVLSNELNIRLQQDLIYGSFMSLQGIRGENVKIMIDDIPIVGRQEGNLDLMQINLNDVERIEIVEGPLSVNYGTNALAGTINIITKKSSKNKTSINFTSYNENIGTYNLNGTLAFQLDKHRISLSGGRNFFQGWISGQNFWPDLSQPVADTTRYKTWKPRIQDFGRLQYNYTFKNLLIGYKGEFFNEKITNRGYPRAPYFESALDDYYYTTRIDNSIYANGKISDNGNIKFTAGYNYYERTKNTYAKDLTTLEQVLSGTPGAQDTSGFDQWMSRGSFSTSRSGSWINYEVGYDINYEKANGIRILDKAQSIGDYALFASAEISPFENFIVKPGLRAAYNTQYDAPLIPSLNLKYGVGDFSFRASYAFGFRAPSIKELYFDFVDINHNIHGNPDLKPEKSDNYSATVTYKLIKDQAILQTEVNGFYNNINNMINLIQSQQDSSYYLYFNIDNSRTTGISVNQSIARNHLKFNLGFSYVGIYNFDSQISHQVTKYSFSPEVRSSIMYEWKKAGLTAAFFYKFNGKTLRPVWDESAEAIINNYLGSYHTADLTLTKSLFENIFVISAGFKNLFDVKNVISQSSASAHSASSTSTPISMGRILFLKLDFNLSK